MGDAMKVGGAFKGYEVSVTPLIGKLRLHVQCYVDKEDFFISPLKHEDVILRAPWFDRMAAIMKFPERKVLFSYRGKELTLDVNGADNTIPVVLTQVYDKVIKSSISCYMVFVKESKESACVLKELCSETRDKSKMSDLLNEFQDVFTDDIPNELPPSRGQYAHTMELLPCSSPPNKPPYRVSQAQQEVMRQVNELVEKGMISQMGACSNGQPLVQIQQLPSLPSS
ncbi:hypothetical protein L7F22_013503 [Adiantum nelumboides]|nr:hypothetical protein [Adiantum nelumboides]